MWFLNRVVNPVVRAVLRSRLHPVLSRQVLLLRITGRRTGRSFEVPVRYMARSGELVVTVGSPERKRWWRNVSGPTPVTVVLRGRVADGVAEVDRSDESLCVRIALQD